ncbi:MAG: flippase [Thermoplasmata archaeon]|nr:MAG: flippase [Thermoplasmata archaeon]
MIARKSFLVFLNMVAGSILGYVALFFIWRYMGAEDYGIIGFGLAFVGLFTFIADMGFGAAHTKRVSEGRDLGRCIGTFYVIKFILISIMAICVLASVFIWKFALGRGFESPYHEPVIYIFILYYIVFGLTSIPLATYGARRETAKQQIPTLLEPLTRVPVAIAVALASFGVLALAGSYLLGVLAILVTAFILFRGYPIGKFDAELFVKYRKFALPLAISSGIVIISLNVDKVMLQLFWGSRYVGYYFGVQKLTTFLISMSLAVTMLLFPTLSKHHGKNEHEEVKRLTSSAERYVSLVVIPCAALLIVFSKPFLRLFGPDLSENAYVVLQIMTVYAVVTCFWLIFFNQLMGVDKPGLSAKISIAMHAINVGLNFILIPKDIKTLGINLFGLGTEGAALATAISAVFGLIMFKHYAKKFTDTRWNPRILLHITAAVIMGAFLFYLTSTFSIWEMYEPFGAGVLELLLYIVLLGGVSLLGIAIYVMILSLFKEFTKDDLKLFLDILNPKGMGRYVATELKDKESKG